MKSELLLAQYKDTEEREFGVLPSKGQFLYPQAVSPQVETSSPIVGDNTFPFVFNAHEGGQFYVELDLSFDLVCKDVDEFHLILQSYAGEKLHSMFARIPLQMDPVTGLIKDTISNQRAAVGTGAQTTFTGYVAKIPVQAGEFAITAASITGTANSLGIITGSGISSGSINFQTGYWTVTFSSAPGNNVPITVTYRNLAAVTQKFQFPIFLEKNRGFAIAFSHEHYKGVKVTVSSFEIRVYASYEAPTVQDSSTPLTEQKVRDILTDYMMKDNFINPDGTVGLRHPMTFRDLLNLPLTFPPASHNHDDRYVLVREFLERVKILAERIEQTEISSHTHWNQGVLDGFHEDSGTLFFKGKRLDNYFEYILNGGKESFRGWAVCSQDWNTEVATELDWNTDNLDHGRLLYADVTHGLALARKNYFRIVLSCCYYDESEPEADRYKLTRHQIMPIVEPVDENTLRIMARDPSTQPNETVSSTRNSGRLWFPCFRVTISAMQGTEAYSGHRPTIIFNGPLREAVV